MSGNSANCPNNSDLLKFLPFTASTVNTLVSNCINLIALHINSYYNNPNDLKFVSMLPPRIKRKLLKKFTLKQMSFDEEAEQILSCLVDLNTKIIDLSGVNDNVLQILESCRNLTEIYFSDIQVSNLALQSFFKNTKFLLILHIKNCKEFDDDTLKILAEHCPNISEINAKFTGIGDGISVLKNLENLKCLAFSHTNVGDSGIGHLVTGKSGCKIQELMINDCQFITDEAIKLVVENCANLQIFTFQNTSVVDHGASLTYVVNYCKNLRQLDYTLNF